MDFNREETEARRLKWTRALLLLFVSLILGGVLTACVTLFSPLSVTNVYVVGDALSIVQASDNAVTDEVDTSGVDIAVTPDGSKAYVSNFANDTVSVVSSSSNEVTTVIDVGDGPRGLAITPDGSRVYVPNENAGTVAIIRTATHEVTDVVDLPSQAANSFPQAIAITPDGERAYVAGSDGLLGPASLKTIRTSNNTVIKRASYNFPFFSDVKISPDGSSIYVTEPSPVAGAPSHIHVINASNLAHEKQVPGGGTGNLQRLIITDDSQQVFATEAGFDQVLVMRTSTNKITDAISVGNDPVGLTLTPDGSRLYVANSGDDTISVIELSDSVQSSGSPVQAAQVSNTIPVGSNPQAVAAGVFVQQPGRIIGGGGQ